MDVKTDVLDVDLDSIHLGDASGVVFDVSGVVFDVSRTFSGANDVFRASFWTSFADDSDVVLT